MIQDLFGGSGFSIVQQMAVGGKHRDLHGLVRSPLLVDDLECLQAQEELKVASQGDLVMPWPLPG